MKKLRIEKKTLDKMLELHNKEGLNETINTIVTECIDEIYHFFDDSNDDVMDIVFFITDGAFGFNLGKLNINRNMVEPLYNIYEEINVKNILFDYYRNIIFDIIYKFSLRQTTVTQGIDDILQIFFSNEQLNELENLKVKLA